MKTRIKFKKGLNTSNVLKYLEVELSKTNLNKSTIKVDKKLRKLIGLTKIALILSDNDIDENTISIDFKFGSFEFKSGNSVLISKKEIESRFKDVFEGTIEYLKTI